MNVKSPLVERKVDTKLILMSAWMALMCLYVYCDIYSLYRPGSISSMMDGKMGPFDVTQMSLFLAGLLMAVPSLMIFATVILAAGASRAINLIISPVYALVNIGNLIGETWAYYYLFGLIELGMVVLIFVVSLKWPRQGAAAS